MEGVGRARPADSPRYDQSVRDYRGTPRTAHHLRSGSIGVRLAEVVPCRERLVGVDFDEIPHVAVSLAAGSLGDGHQEVFVVDLDDTIWHSWWNWGGDGWSQWIAF